MSPYLDGDANPHDRPEGRKPSEQTQLVQIAQEWARLFRSPTDEAFAQVTVEGHVETLAVRSASFRGWLAREFYLVHQRPPSSKSVRDATEAIEGEALCGTEVHEAHVRLAVHEGAIYLDLADAERNVVKVAPREWEVVSDPPVRFRRPKGMLPLPVPEHGGSIDELWGLWPGLDAHTQVLLTGALLAGLQPHGSLPVLFMNGEQGSGKTMLAGQLKAIVDPAQAPLRGAPTGIEALMISAMKARVLALDNISHFPPWLSDALCRLSSGGGLSKRQLYTDDDECILEACRPVIVNGIEDLVTRGDLLERSLLVTLPAIAAKNRRSEQAVREAFAAARPRVLGALLDAAATGLANLPSTEVAELPRLADFCLWVEACSPALGWPPGVFVQALAAHRQESSSVALDASPVAQAVLKLSESIRFEGIAQELLDDLNERETDGSKRSPAWPKTARKLAGDLRRLAPDLRRHGVHVSFLKRSGARRVIRIERTEGRAEP